MKEEYKHAQRGLYEGGTKIGYALMHLNYTKYEAEAKRVMNAINRLNNKLIKEINK